MREAILKVAEDGENFYATFRVHDVKVDTAYRIVKTGTTVEMLRKEVARKRPELTKISQRD